MCCIAISYAVPSFTDFTEDSKSTDQVSVTWDLESPGVRPVEQVIVRWMEENDRTQLPLPEDFPANNTQIFDSPSQTFSCNFTGLSPAQRYVVLIQGTNLAGTSNTYFVIETGKILGNILMWFWTFCACFPLHSCWMLTWFWTFCVCCPSIVSTEVHKVWCFHFHRPTAKYWFNWSYTI